MPWDDVRRGLLLPTITRPAPSRGWPATGRPRSVTGPWRTSSAVTPSRMRSWPARPLRRVLLGSRRRLVDEEERVYAHLRDPFHRVDVRRIAHPVRVLAGDRLLAESRQGVIVSETGLPDRWYVPADDCRLDLLSPTETRTTARRRGGPTTGGCRTSPAPAMSLGRTTTRSTVWPASAAAWSLPVCGPGPGRRSGGRHRLAAEALSEPPGSCSPGGRDVRRPPASRITKGEGGPLFPLPVREPPSPSSESPTTSRAAPPRLSMRAGGGGRATLPPTSTPIRRSARRRSPPSTMMSCSRSGWP